MIGGSTPTISVIMPAYNCARFVTHAIESILAQTWQDWELIVIDDGSTDATPDILARINDRRVVVVQQENSGAAAARNTGLRIAHGDFIAFLDADDLYLPNALNDLVDFLHEHPKVDVVFSDGYFGDEHGQFTMRLSEHRPGLHTGDILEPLVLSPSVISGIICTMSRRAFFKANNIFFDEDLVIGEDWDFWIQVAARHARFDYMDRPTCVYRVHQTNTTRTANDRQRRADLVSGRFKVVRAPWFGELSLTTQREFYYQLLIGHLAGDQEQQLKIMSEQPFVDMPPVEQVRLHRLVATNCLLTGGQPEFARQCLDQGLTRCPNEVKSQRLRKSLDLSPAVTKAMLTTWQGITTARRWFRNVGRHDPKPAPAGFRQ